LSASNSTHTIMPYKKTGICKVPRPRYIPQMCQLIMDAFGETFDMDVALAIKTLANERELLRNFFFERTLLLNYPKLESNPKLKFAFQVVLVDFLHQVGYIDVSPVQFEYITDPVMGVDELLDTMLGTRMPTFKATDLGGEYASISTLSVFFPDVIRRNALVQRERPYMAQRYREWLGNIGFRLMTTSSEQLSQSDRSFLVIHGCCQEGSKGYIASIPGINAPIPPIENKDPLVVEIGALAVASCMAGPCTNHMKMISNGILEQLVFYYGPHVSDLKTSVGYMRKYGPFFVFDVSPEDSIPWLLESQITGITAQAANITVRPDNQPAFTLRMPLPIKFKNDFGDVALYPDIPGFHLYLTNEKDISDFTWDYYSAWRGRLINSRTDGGTMDYYMCDLAVSVKTAGGMQVEATELPANTLCWLAQSAVDKITAYDGNIVEEYVLPSDKGLVRKLVNMTAYYARFGSIEFLPAFSEFVELPLAWFLQPAPRVIDYICSVEGLTISDRVRFEVIIALCHNCSRYTRITKQELPLARDRYILALLNEGIATTIPTANKV
jgi:hypothetical protein